MHISVALIFFMPLRDGVTGSTLGFGLSSGGSNPSPVASNANYTAGCLLEYIPGCHVPENKVEMSQGYACFQSEIAKYLLNFTI